MVRCDVPIARPKPSNEQAILAGVFVNKMSKEKFGRNGCPNFFLYFCCGEIFDMLMTFRAHTDFRQRRSRALLAQGEPSCLYVKQRAQIQQQKMQAYCADR